VAVVTGASRGIGRAIAGALVGAGARVAIVARGAGPLEEEAATLGANCRAFPADMANPAAVTALTDALVAHYGDAPDLVVSNAGLFHVARAHELSAEAFTDTVQVNLVAPFLLVRSLLPRMRARGRGHLVTIGSIADRAIFPENAAYAAAKHGARALHEVLRAELAGTGVRASLVSPGPVDTDLWNDVLAEGRPGYPPRSAMLATDAVADAVLWVVTRPPAVNVDELRLTRS
jgi:NADP-dependent 3-hydroxy acid dehydrogenase YdfG